MLTEEPLDGEGIQLSFTTVNQPQTQQMVKAPVSALAIKNHAVAKGKKSLHQAWDRQVLQM